MQQSAGSEKHLFSIKKIIGHHRRSMRQGITVLQNQISTLGEIIQKRTPFKYKIEAVFMQKHSLSLSETNHPSFTKLFPFHYVIQSSQQPTRDKGSSYHLSDN